MGSPILFAGNTAKLLKSTLDFNGQAQILSGTTDPSSVATSAPIGSIYLNSSNANLYRKTDSGSSTNWAIIGASAVVTTWTSFTPTITGLGTITGSKFKYRQVGNVYEVQGIFAPGTPTAVLAKITLPNGASIDASQLADHNLTSNPGPILGIWGQNGFNNNVGPLIACTDTDATVVYFGSGYAVSNAMLTAQNGNGVINASQTVSVRFEVPISGLGSTVSTSYLPVAARYFASATSISSSLATIVYTTSDYDTSSAYSSGIFTVPTGGGGKYQINASLLTTGTVSLNNTLIIEIQKNNSVISRETQYLAAGLTDAKARISDIISLSPADTIRIQASSGASAPSIVASNFDNYVSIIKVSS